MVKVVEITLLDQGKIFEKGGNFQSISERMEAACEARKKINPAARVRGIALNYPK